VVLAGQRPGIDALAAHFGQKLKALVPLAGKPMLARVLDTLGKVPQISDVVVMAQDTDALRGAVGDRTDVRFATSSGGISASLIDAIEGREVSFPLLVTTADHPLLTPEMVCEFLAGAGGDLTVGMVAKSLYDPRFAGERRTWLRFRGEAWSGANLFAFTGEPALGALRLWRRAEQDRKTAWKLFARFGPVLMLRALTRTITLPEALHRAGKRLGLDARLIALSYPVAAIDVDKPADHALALRILAARGQD